MPSNADPPPRASLLGPPREVRLRIYEAGYEQDDDIVQLYGRVPGAERIAKRIEGALAPPRICRLTRNEVMPVRPAISRLHFRFEDIDKDDLECWSRHEKGRCVQDSADHHRCVRTLPTAPGASARWKSQGL